MCIRDSSTTVEIELRDLKSILDDVVIGDYAEFHAEEIAGGYAVAIDKFMSDRVLSKITEFNQKAFLNSSAKKPYKSIEISEEGLELIEFLSLDLSLIHISKAGMNPKTLQYLMGHSDIGVTMNTYTPVSYTHLHVFEENGVEYETIQVGKMDIRGCAACEIGRAHV